MVGMAVAGRYFAEWVAAGGRGRPFIPFPFNDSVSLLNKLKLEAKMLSVAKIETTDTLL